MSTTLRSAKSGPPGVRSNRPSQSASCIASSASAKRAVAARKRSRSSSGAAAASSSMSVSRASDEAYIGSARPRCAPWRTPARPSPLRARWATTWPRVQPGSCDGSAYWVSGSASTVRTSARSARAMVSGSGLGTSITRPSCHFHSHVTVHPAGWTMGPLSVARERVDRCVGLPTATLRDEHVFDSVNARTRTTVADQLIIRGAREHNLKDVSLDLPRDSLIVFTGLSGSGKSSLAFDTIFAEGQRRYVESLSAYARQFLGQMDKPDVDFIEGLSPAVSIDQKSTSRNPRSTVGTITEVYDYLRLLYARAGRPHCPTCGEPIERQTPQQIVDRMMQLDEGTRFQVLAPVVRGRKGEYVDLFRQLQSQGFSRARVDGEIHPLTEPPTLDKQKKHTIEVIVDRLAV